MNHRKLTQRNLEIYTRRSKIHTILLVLFISLLAGTGRAQVIDRSKERTDKQGKEKDRRRPTLDLAKIARTSEGEESPTEVFAAAASATSSSSQAASDLSNFAVFGNVGVTVPHGDFSTFADPGFSFNGGLEYMITSQFSVEGILGFHRFKQFPGFFGDHTNLYQVSANGKFYFVDESSKVRPFVNGGVGVYVTDAATAHFGGNVGGGGFIRGHATFRDTRFVQLTHRNFGLQRVLLNSPGWCPFGFKSFRVTGRKVIYRNRSVEATGAGGLKFMCPYLW